jgi:uncharacterized protein HemX
MTPRKLAALALAASLGFASAAGAQPKPNEIDRQIMQKQQEMKQKESELQQKQSEMEQLRREMQALQEQKQKAAQSK